MFKRFLSLLFFFTVYFAAAQIGQPKDVNPVSWEGRVEKTAEDEYNLIFNATIDPEWHVYSQHTPDGGPLPLELTFYEQEGRYDLVGEAHESETTTEFSDIFGVDEIFFSENATITQKVRLQKEITIIKAELFYQVCKEVCINGEFYFAFDLENNEATVFKNFTDFENFGTGKVKQVKEADLGNSPQEKKERGFLTIFIIAFLSGFAALLTPCVFPMIPMTVAYFTKRSADRAKGKSNAIIYAICIVLIYVLLGTLVTAVFGADALNRLATNAWFNIVFFVLLVVFAISFFGAFEIMLPQSWANAVDRQADRGGLIGIFFMALALAIVSFSCTGPIVGTLLVEAASQGGVAPVIGMLGFSLAIAIPFGLFALFPGWLNSLPKSGGWLNSVKVVLGFLELALAFKFLSNADLVLQLHWLEREVFLAIWIAIFGAMTLYLFGRMRLPHDSPDKTISVGRLLFGLLTLSFTIYLIPGIWGAPLKLISGITPPMFYSESPFGVGYAKPEQLEELDIDFQKYVGYLPPNNIMYFKDYEVGMAYAKEENKPVLLDFTGYNCANCRKMEERVWGEPEILPILKNEVVLISLYVDSDEELPTDEHSVSPTTGRKIDDIGDKWSDFQIRNYGISAQPYYVLLDTEGNRLNEPVSYTPDVKTYQNWLIEGIENFTIN